MQITREMIEKMTRGNDWISYDNGNYTVWLNIKNGSKIRHTEDDEFNAAFPESMDIKITNRCDMGCPWCHENSTPTGKHADLDQDFTRTFHYGQEIAVGGGNVLTHPDLEHFLKRLVGMGCHPSITVNQKHFIESYDRIKNLYDDGLVRGIGISLSDSTDHKLIELAQTLPTAVLHTIAGLFTLDDIKNLSNNGLKVLVLGYKDIRRGSSYLRAADSAVMGNIDWLKNNLDTLMKAFKVVSFDNLALEQLDVREFVGEEKWENFYMGDDGAHTFYIDMVEKEYALSSTSMNRKEIGSATLDEMFTVIKAEHDAERGTHENNDANRNVRD